MSPALRRKDGRVQAMRGCRPVLYRSGKAWRSAARTSLVLLVCGCAAAGDGALNAQCRAIDGDAGVYDARDLNEEAALERALYQCQLDARDPTSCRTAGCRAPE